MQIVLEPDTAEQLKRMADWGETPAQVVDRLLHMVQTSPKVTTSVPKHAAAPSTNHLIPVYAIYGKRRRTGLDHPVRINAVYDMDTQAVTVTSGPCAGQKFAAPSPAAKGAIRALNPNTQGSISGWDFWLTSSGAALRALKPAPRR